MQSQGVPSQSGRVRSRVAGGIARIEFSHPKANSLPSTLLKQLTTAFLEAGGDPLVRVILLSSGGNGAFCAGASFQELYAAENQEAATEFFLGFARLLEAMLSCPKVVVCRVQGKSVGGGVGLVAACDYALAHKDASVRLSELAVGIGPFVIAPCLQRKIPTAQVAAMAFDTDWRDATWAARYGLFASVHASAGDLDSSVEALLSRLSRSSPAALSQLKDALWTDTCDWGELLRRRAAISGSLAVQPATRETIRSLLQEVEKA